MIGAYLLHIFICDIEKTREILLKITIWNKSVCVDGIQTCEKLDNFAKYKILLKH